METDKPVKFDEESSTFLVDALESFQSADEKGEVFDHALDLLEPRVQVIDLLYLFGAEVLLFIGLLVGGLQVSQGLAHYILDIADLEFVEHIYDDLDIFKFLGHRGSVLLVDLVRTESLLNIADSPLQLRDLFTRVPLPLWLSKVELELRGVLWVLSGRTFGLVRGGRGESRIQVTRHAFLNVLAEECKVAFDGDFREGLLIELLEDFVCVHLRKLVLQLFHLLEKLELILVLECQLLLLRSVLSPVFLTHSLQFLPEFQHLEL